MALLQVNFYSDVLGMSMNMAVILPQNPVRKPPYPVLFLLHGKGDDHASWQRFSAIERYVQSHEIAVVMPTTHLGYYTDMAHGLPYFTFISKELPEICRGLFPSISSRREDTFVAGLSMGGYGAVKCALGAPMTFGYGASLSGPLDINERTRELYDNPDTLPYVLNVFGKQAQMPGSDNDLFALAERLVSSGMPLPELFICCGTEDPFYDYSFRGQSYMKELGLPVTYQESSGAHDWSYWDRQILHVLEWLPI